MKIPSFCLANLYFLTAAMTGTVRAATVTLYDNTATKVEGLDVITAPSTGNGPLFQSFFSDSTDSTLNSLDLSLVNLGSGTSDTISIALYADAASSYGSWIASLGTITDSTVTSTTSLYSVALTAHPSLAANTRYWIGLSEPGTAGLAAWNGARDDTGTGVAGGYYYNAGLGYQANSEGDNTPYIMKVTATTVVPEPTTTASLVGLLCLGAGVWLRQRRAA